MAFIEVEFSEIDSLSGSVDNCLSTLETEKNNCNSVMNEVKSAWNGSDSDVFIGKWNEFVHSDSSYSKLKYSLESFQRYINYCKAQYMHAQSDAVCRANRIF